MHKQILRLAIPSIITNITVPLLGMVDVAIVGHIGNADHIAAIALATMVFNLIYWNFGFLRMGTGGLTAQACGAGDREACTAILTRGMAMALGIASVLLLLQGPIAFFCKKLIDSSSETIDLMLSYFYVRIWAAPATLGLYVLKGWFIGMQNARSPMVIAIVLNIVNILFGLLFVVVFHLGIEGVAWGTVIAQYSGLALAVALWFCHYGELRHCFHIKESLKIREMVHFFKINTDLFLRSICLIAVFTFIPYISAKMGNTVLAANTLLMQLFTLQSYILDGFAYAGEALTGNCIGARASKSLHRIVRQLLLWGFIFAAAFTLLYAFFGNGIFRILTNDPIVIGTAMGYLTWALLVPMCGFAAFIFDGVYVGATASKEMRNIMCIATAAFFLLYFLLINKLGNNAIWFAFTIFLLLRSLLMLFRNGKVIDTALEKTTTE